MGERISYMVSQWHKWFIELGYPELDILRYDDGEFWIIQYYSSPVIPALTKWQTVLGPMRNMEISKEFCRKYVHQLDITKRAFWDREEKKTQEVLDEADAVDRHKFDSVDRAHKAITRNPDLMERIAKRGIGEMDIPSIALHVPRGETFKSTIKGTPFKGGQDVDSTTEVSGSAGNAASSETANLHSSSESTQ